MLDNTMAQSNLAIAENLALAGFAVFPCRASGKPKTPLVKWRSGATRNIEIVRSWWAKWPDALVGLPTGEANGITVLDIDKKNGVDGFASLAVLGIDLDVLACPKVRTPSGGLHAYFRYTPDLRNSAGKLGPGLDVRNDGGYVIVAGEIVGQGRYQAVGL